jgi:DNA-binding NtrC family response regulator
MAQQDVSTGFEVLVVDDEAGARELLVDYFRSLGFLVTGAQDGRSAIATLQQSGGRFGLVVTDLNLPSADGFAVLQAARQANAACFIVIVTGYASLDSAIRAVRVGAYDYLTKPFALSQLDVILARIRDRLTLEQETRSVRVVATSHPVVPMVPAAVVPAALPPAPAVPELPPPIEQRLASLEDSVRRLEQLLTAHLGL